MKFLSDNYSEFHADAHTPGEDVTTTGRVAEPRSLKQRIAGLKSEGVVVHAAVEPNVWSDRGTAVQFDRKRGFDVVVCPTRIPVVDPVVIAVADTRFENEVDCVGEAESALKPRVVIPTT
ncbi:MAG: hypothetical protein AAGC68_11415 [Verrucomicrobiota bacterium]